MLLLIRRNSVTHILKETSNFLKASSVTKKYSVFASEIGEAEEFQGDTRRRQKKYGIASSYNKDTRYNQKSFPPSRNNIKYQSSWQGGQMPVTKATNESLKSENTEALLFQKFFYVEHPDVTQRSLDDVKDYRSRMNISVNGVNIPKPVTKFSELCLPEKLTEALKKENYPEPTAVQAQGWPVALSGRDMIGVSQTGSGKTLAYMLPGVVHAVNQNTYKNREKGGSSKPVVLVLAPTRELVQQIHHVSKAYIESCGLSGATVYGGASRHFQLCCLEGADICIATPGRLLDFLSCREVSLRYCSYLVLDEADRMLDMGFEPQIRNIIDQMESDRQTLMWSATWPSEIRNLAEDFLNDYIHITIGSGDLVANPNIKQNILVVNEMEKEGRLISLLENLIIKNREKVLVFAQTKRKVDYLSNLLNMKRIPALGIHGDISQFRRDKILNSFRMNKSSVLIATDVAARGLDITDIQHVVNFDFPLNIEDYVHRIGRTARGSSSGIAHSFFTSENCGLLNKLFSVLRRSNQEINADLQHLADMNKKSYNTGFNNKMYPRRRYNY